MATLYEINTSKTYKTKETAVKAVEKMYGAYPELRYFVHTNSEGRFVPVFFGAKALEYGVHFHFNVIG